MISCQYLVENNGNKRFCKRSGTIQVKGKNYCYQHAEISKTNKLVRWWRRLKREESTRNEDSDLLHSVAETGKIVGTLLMIIGR